MTIKNDNLYSRFPHFGKLTLAIIENIVSPILGEAGIEIIKEPAANHQLLDKLCGVLVKTEKRFIQKCIEEKIADGGIVQLKLANLPSIRRAFWTFFKDLSVSDFAEAIDSQLRSNYPNGDDTTRTRAVILYMQILRDGMIEIDINSEAREKLGVFALHRIEDGVEKIATHTAEMKKIMGDIYVQLEQLVNSPNMPAHQSKAIDETKKLPAKAESQNLPRLPFGSWVPFLHNLHFIPHSEKYLETLEKKLILDTESKALTVPQIIFGMGGVGKTQIGIEFCHKYGHHFDGVHWIDAHRMLEEEIAFCGEKMDLPNWPQTLLEQTRMTLNAWKKSPSRLIVLDNLNDPLLLQKWMPKFEGLSILVISLSSIWRTHQVHAQRIRDFDRDESLDLLRQLAPRLEATPDDELSKVAERLGDLPLALDLAGQYFKDNPALTPDIYLEQLKNVGAFQHVSLRSWVKDYHSPTGHTTSLEETFLVSWKKLDRNTDPLEWLFFISAGYLAPNIPIPKDIFYAIADVNEDVNRIKKAISHLQELALLSELSENCLLHPLLAEFAQTRTHNHKTLVLLAKKITTISNEEYPEHIETLALILEETGLMSASVLWKNQGSYYVGVNEYDAAVSAYQRALEIEENKDKKNSREIANILNHLGNAFQELGDLNSAGEYYQRVLGMWDEAYGENDPNIANILNDLGNAFQELGDLSSARDCYQQALPILENTYGKDHPAIANILSNLGNIFQKLGDLSSARDCYQQALPILENMYGKDNLAVANILNNLGNIFQKLGKVSSAQDYYQQAFLILENTYGKDHQEVARISQNIADIRRKLGENI